MRSQREKIFVENFFGFLCTSTYEESSPNWPCYSCLCRWLRFLETLSREHLSTCKIRCTFSFKDPIFSKLLQVDGYAAIFVTIRRILENVSHIGNFALKTVYWHYGGAVAQKKSCFRWKGRISFYYKYLLWIWQEKTSDCAPVMEFAFPCKKKKGAERAKKNVKKYSAFPIKKGGGCKKWGAWWKPPRKCFVFVITKSIIFLQKVTAEKRRSEKKTWICILSTVCRF